MPKAQVDKVLEQLSGLWQAYKAYYVRANSNSEDLVAHAQVFHHCVQELALVAKVLPGANYDMATNSVFEPLIQVVNNALGIMDTVVMDGKVPFTTDSNGHRIVKLPDGTTYNVDKRG